MNPFQSLRGFDWLAGSYMPLGFLAGTILLLLKIAQAQPSRRAFLLILLPVPLLVLAFRWPWLESAFQLYTPLLGLAMLIDAFWLSVPAHRLTLSRQVETPCQIGLENSVTLTLHNQGARPIQGWVEDGAPPDLLRHLPPAARRLPVALASQGTCTLHYTLLPLDRGSYPLAPARLRYQSRLGLLWLGVTGAGPDTLSVAPNLRRVRRMRIRYSRSLSRGELQKRSLGLEGTRFSGLRNYFHGDDVRRIAWQATAKLDVPIIRTYEPEVEQPILVLLDAGRRMMGRTTGKQPGIALRKFDWALNAALAFLSVAQDRGDCVGFGAFSNRILAHVPVGQGASHLRRVQDAMAALQAEPVEPQYEAALLQFARSLKRRALIILMTDLIDPAAARSLLKGLKAFSAGHLLLVVTLADTELSAQLATLPQSSLEAYQRGIAQDLRALRQHTLGELNRGHRSAVVEAAPDELDTALIQRYLALKRRNQF